MAELKKIISYIKYCGDSKVLDSLQGLIKIRINIIKTTELQETIIKAKSNNSDNSGRERQILSIRG